MTSRSERIKASCFYRLRSPHKLAEILDVTYEQLSGLCDAGSANYVQFFAGDRWIETPKTLLKRRQRRIHDLLSRIPAPEYLHSAYKGESAILNAASHRPGVPMIKLDIRRFFPSSDGRRVFDLFAGKFETSPDVASRIWRLCTIKGTRNAIRSHLPTGAPTSPILAFFIYEEMFASIEAIAREFGLTLSVFADDIALSGAQADRARKRVRAVIEDFGLVSHRKKEKFWPANYGSKVVTGALVTPKGLRVPLSRKQNIARFKELLRRAITPMDRAKAYQRLYGALNSAGLIESRFAVGARCVLTEWQRDSQAWQIHVSGSVNG